ncbi:hypothetical protein [Plastoroseomonas arctica]|uniref:Uncharacterized protein n=1 Tax=Plastoroseomonas arctica TaxID=1509237 RepID=A0AAF1KIZ1_9PROT|nr:hypothetical protein [Plastoroseomonas arctica]MBR0654525.1 hypothetical protein [Plastoroseomonas arctica]
MPLYIFGTGGHIYEEPSLFIAVVAWPELLLRDDTAFDHHHACLVAYMLRAQADIEPTWASRPHFLKPCYLFPSRIEIFQSMTKTLARFGQAMTCALIARPFVAARLFSDPPPLPPGLERTSLNAVMNYVLGTRTDQPNFEQKVFRRHKPVLHLALALDQWLLRQRTPLEVIFLGHGLPWLVNQAQQLEGPVSTLQQFRVDPAGQIQIRLRELVSTGVPSEDTSKKA